MSFEIKSRQCDTCIYRKKTPDGKRLHWPEVAQRLGAVKEVA